MSHNIATARDASGHNNDYIPSGDLTPEVGPLWQNPVLTVQNNPYRSQPNKATITMLFHGGGDLGPAHIVVNPWHADGPGPTIHIDGEDLYALRALLAEFPEEAFKTPKPAVKVPTQTWTPGDTVIFNPEGPVVITYTRLGSGYWQRVSAIGEGADPSISEYDDAYIEAQLLNAPDSYRVLHQAVKA